MFRQERADFFKNRSALVGERFERRVGIRVRPNVVRADFRKPRLRFRSGGFDSHEHFQRGFHERADAFERSGQSAGSEIESEIRTRYHVVVGEESSEFFRFSFRRKIRSDRRAYHDCV